MERMEYATDILRTLLLQLVEKSVSSKYPQLMLRRTESVVEKMLTNWLALTMYDYMRQFAASQLFLLFSALKHQIEKGPIDVMTHEARYSLSEERLLREHYCNYEQLLLIVFQSERPLDKYHVRVNDCDTIGQVKGKILDVIYKNTPHSERPSVNDFDLEWRDQITGSHMLLQDVDYTSQNKRDREHHQCSIHWQRLNTLKHYQVKNMALVMLITKPSHLNYQHQQKYTTATMRHHGTSMLYHSTNINKQNNENNNSNKHSFSSSSFYPLLMGSPNNTTTSFSDRSLTSIGTGGCVTDIDNDHFWHLVKPDLSDLSTKEGGSSGSGSSSSSGSVLMHKAIPEIFLTRLLSTKGTIQKFVDDFFRTILSVNDALPG